MVKNDLEIVESACLRLELFSLSAAVMHLASEECKEQYSNENYEKAKLLWKLGKTIINKTENAYDSIHFMEILIYFHPIGIHSELIQPQRNQYVKILKDCGFIYSIESDSLIKARSPTLIQVIKQENQNTGYEKDLLRECLLMLRKSVQHFPEKEKFFLAVWKNALNRHLNLVKEFLDDGYWICENYFRMNSNSKPVGAMWDMLGTVEAFSEIGTNIKVKCLALQLELIFEEVNLKFSIELILKKWKNYLSAMEEHCQNNAEYFFHHQNFESEYRMMKMQMFSDEMYELGLGCGIISNSKRRSEFLEAALSAYRMIFQYFTREQLQNRRYKVKNGAEEAMLQIFKCLTELDRKEEIFIPNSGCVECPCPK